MEAFFIISIILASSYFLYTVIIEKREKKKLPSKTENKPTAIPTSNTGSSLRRQPEWARQLEEKKKKDLETRNTKQIEKSGSISSGDYATPIDSTSKEESSENYSEPGLTKESLEEKKEKTMRFIEDILKDSSPQAWSLQQLKDTSGRVIQFIEQTIQENSEVPESDSHQTELAATAEPTSIGIDSRFKKSFTFEITGAWETVDDPEAADVEDEDPDPIRKLALKAVRSMEAEMSATQLVYSVTTASSAVRELKNGVLTSAMDYDQALHLGKRIDQSNAAHLFTDELVNITEIIANIRPEMSREVNRAFADITEQYDE